MAGSTEIIEEKYEVPLEPTSPAPALPCEPGRRSVPSLLDAPGTRGDAGSRGEATQSSLAGVRCSCANYPDPGAQAGFPRSMVGTQTRQTSRELLCLCRFGVPVGMQGGVPDGAGMAASDRGDTGGALNTKCAFLK